MSVNTNILIYLNNFQKYYRQMFKPLAQKYEFAQIEIDILLFLHNNPSHNTARDICEMRGLAKSNVSTSLESLRRRGVITSLADPKSRKLHRLTLAPAYEEIVNELARCQEQCFSVLTEDFSEEELAAFKSSLKHINANVLNALKNPNSSETN